MRVFCECGKELEVVETGDGTVTVAPCPDLEYRLREVQAIHSEEIGDMQVLIEAAQAQTEATQTTIEELQKEIQDLHWYRREWQSDNWDRGLH